MIAPIDQLAGQQITLGTIENRAKAHAAARAALAEELNALREELDAAQKRRMKTIKSLAARAACTEADLHAVIEQGSALFVKPRTLTLHGIKVGFRESKGKIVFDDSDSVVKLIKKFFPESVDVLIHMEETPSKTGLKTLDEKQLKAIGCRIEGAGDKVVLDAVDDQIEKQIASLISKMVETMLDDKEA